MPAFYPRVLVVWVRKISSVCDSQIRTLSLQVGSAIVGRISDFTVIKWRKKRKGVWYPEDRLRAAVIPFAVLLPLSVLGFGLVNKFVDGNVGLMFSLVCLFFSGSGVSGSLNVVRILQKTNYMIYFISR